MSTINLLLSKTGHAARSVFRFYYDGFRSMTIGKKLWVLILVKLFLFFVVMKLFFFPNVLQRDYDNDEDRAAHVRHELIGNPKGN